MIRAQGNTKIGVKGNTDKECFRCGATSEPITEPRLTSMEDLRNLHPGVKAFEIMRRKSKTYLTPCHFALLIWGLLMCRQTGDDVVVDESSVESTGTMPPLPLVSWFKETRT